MWGRGILPLYLPGKILKKKEEKKPHFSVAGVDLKRNWLGVGQDTDTVAGRRQKGKNDASTILISKICKQKNNH